MAKKRARRPAPRRSAPPKGKTRPQPRKPLRRAPARPKAKRRAKVAESFRHGQAARERTERRLTPAQRAARTRDANRIEREVLARKLSERSRKGWVTRRAKAEAIRRALERPEDFYRGTPSRSAAPRSSSSRSMSLTDSPTPMEPTTGETLTATPPPTSIPKSGSGDSTDLEKTFSFQTGSGDALRVQISVRARLPPGADPTNRLLYGAIAYKLDNGTEGTYTQTDHRFMKCRIIRWQNPGRKTKKGRAWRHGNQEDAWVTLGPAIRAAIRREYGF